MGCRLAVAPLLRPCASLDAQESPGWLARRRASQLARWGEQRATGAPKRSGVLQVVSGQRCARNAAP
eukprot:15434415-Alexandrium_andersonii.AAC.1